jgi:hypothetical protein
VSEHRHDYRRCTQCEEVIGETLSSEERIEVIRAYAQAHRGIRTFIETGTADGATVAGLLGEFERLHTIELNIGAWQAAVQKFANQPKVTCHQGESDKILPSLMYLGPAVFWLDAHWCGGVRGAKATPVLEELDVILRAGHADVILVDDVRLFGTEPEWPELAEVVKPLRDAGYIVEVTDDVLRAVPG